MIWLDVSYVANVHFQKYYGHEEFEDTRCRETQTGKAVLGTSKWA